MKMINNNIQIIGPGAWYMIHLMCGVAHYSKAQRAAALSMIETIRTSFFCDKCRNHFNEFVKKNDPSKLTKEGELFKWSVDAHNNVNRMNGKKEFTYDQAHAKYMGATCSGDCGFNDMSGDVDENPPTAELTRQLPHSLMDNAKQNMFIVFGDY